MQPQLLRIAESVDISVATFGKIVEQISPTFGAFFKHEAAVIESGDFAITESPTVGTRKR